MAHDWLHLPVAWTLVMAAFMALFAKIVSPTAHIADVLSTPISPAFAISAALTAQAADTAQAGSRPPAQARHAGPAGRRYTTTRRHTNPHAAVAGRTFRPAGDGGGSPPQQAHAPHRTPHTRESAHARHVTTRRSQLCRRQPQPVLDRGRRTSADRLWHTIPPPAPLTVIAFQQPQHI